MTIVLYLIFGRGSTFLLQCNALILYSVINLLSLAVLVN